jgi:hypothetical protein
MNRINVGPFGPALTLVGLNYVHDASDDAWRRILSFFDTHLRAR